MAKITTYTAPLERLRPSDLGYTSQIQLGRRLSGFASETLAALRANTELEASALKQGGALESQNIITQRRGAVALMEFLASADAVPATQRAISGGGGGGGSLGNTAAPREVARAAPALVQALNRAAPAVAAGKPPPEPVRYHEIKRPGMGEYDDYLNGPTLAMGEEGRSALGAEGGRSVNNVQAPGFGRLPTSGGRPVYDPNAPAGLFPGSVDLSNELGTAPYQRGGTITPDTGPAAPSVFQSWLDWASGAVSSATAAVSNYTPETDY